MQEQPRKPHSLSSKRLGNDVDAFLRYMRKEKSGLSTGLKRLDQKLLGLAGFVALVGEPKACKSTLAMQIALHNASNGIPVYFVDQENGRRRLAKRMLCNRLDATWTTLPQEGGLGEAYASLSELPFYLHCGKLPFEQLQTDVDELFSFHPQSPGLLVIDSLQAMASKAESMRASVDELLIGLDQLKLAYDGRLTILVVCEKRRGVYGEAAIDAAKESGRIEYKVEQQLDLRNSADGSAVIVECTANRDGPKGIVVPLKKVCKDPSNESSFLFKLEEKNLIPL